MHTPDEFLEDLKGGIEDICPKMDLTFDQIKMMTSNAYVRPQNMVRGGKFLIPILGYGRMTQLRNLVEATMVALYTNRTLVLPPFYSDPWTDTDELGETPGGYKYTRDNFTSETVMEPFTQIETDDLRQFIRVISWQDFDQKCGDHLNSVILGHGNYCKGPKFWRMESFQSYKAVS